MATPTIASGTRWTAGESLLLRNATRMMPRRGGVILLRMSDTATAWVVVILIITGFVLFFYKLYCRWFDATHHL